MSLFKREDQLGFPAATDKTIAKLLGIIQRKSHYQAAAASASLSLLGQVELNAVLGDIYVIVAATGGVLGAGESMTYDIQLGVGGVYATILTGGPFVVNSSSLLTGQLSLSPLMPSTITAPIGSVLKVTRVYTAGGSPTMLDNTVFAEVSDHAY